MLSRLTRMLWVASALLLAAVLVFVGLLQAQRRIWSLDDAEAHHRGERYGLSCRAIDDPRAAAVDALRDAIGAHVDGELAAFRRSEQRRLDGALYRVVGRPSEEDVLGFGTSVAVLERVDAIEAALRVAYGKAVACRNAEFTQASAGEVGDALLAAARDVQVFAVLPVPREDVKVAAARAETLVRSLVAAAGELGERRAGWLERDSEDALYTTADLLRLGRAAWKGRGGGR